MEQAATPTSRTGTSRGFTTVELMVVLAIMVVVSSMVVVSMSPALRDARIRSGCRIIASALKYARSSAVTRGAYTRVVLDTARGGVSVLAYERDQNGEERLFPLTTQSGRYRQLPRGVRIEIVRKPGTDVSEAYVGFSEAGRADQAEIVLKDESGKRRAVVVDGITGHCSIQMVQQL